MNVLRIRGEDGQFQCIPILKGDSGKSAYEIAKDLGFEGDESLWLESLKGSSGPAGEQGIQGEQGLQGIQGPAGQDGLNGTDGKDGIGISSLEVNNDGELVITYTDNQTINLGQVVGAKGEKGDIGPTGPEGPQGPQGEKGQDGTSVTDSIVLSDDGEGNVSMTWDAYDIWQGGEY